MYTYSIKSSAFEIFSRIRIPIGAISALVYITAIIALVQPIHSQWREIGAGLKGGYVVSLSSNDKYAFISTSNGDVYRRPLGGGGWQRCKSNSESMYAPRLTVTPKTLIYASDEEWVSTDDGDSWQKVTMPETCYGVMHCSQNLVVTASNSAHLMVSSDYGQHWSLPDSANAYYALGLSVQNGMLFCISFDRKVLASSDLGQSWSQLSGITLDSLDSYTMEVFNNWLCIRSYKGKGFYSTDGASTWKPVAFKGGSSPMCRYRDSIAVVYSYKLYVTGDTAKTWTEYALPEGAQESGTLLAKGDTLLLSSSIGVIGTTDDFKHWFLQNEGCRSFYVSDIARGGNEYYLSTDCAGVWRSTDIGESWLGHMPKEEYYRSEYALAPFSDTLLLGRSFRGMSRTVSYGTHWDEYPTGVEAIDTDAVSEYVIDKQHAYALTSMQGVLAVSTNRGVTWNTCAADSSVYAGYYLDVSASNDTVMSLKRKTLCTSTDGATTWRKVDLDFSQNGFHRVCHKNSDVWIGSFGDGVFHSSNLGKDWSVSNGIGMVNTNVIALRMIDSMLVAASQAYKVPDTQNKDSLARNDVYISTDKGGHWISIKDNLPPGYIALVRVIDTMIFVQMNDCRLFCRSARNALLPTQVDIDAADNTSAVQLMANTELLAADIPTLRHDGALRLLNIQGAVLHQWSAEDLESGSSIDLRSYSSGVYLLKSNRHSAVLRICR